MNNGTRLPLIFMGGGNFLPLKKKKKPTERKFTTWRCTSLFLYLFAHWARQTVVRNETAAVAATRSYRLLVDYTCLFYPLFLREKHLKRCRSRAPLLLFCDSKYGDDSLPLLQNADGSRGAAGRQTTPWGRSAMGLIITRGK